MVLYMPFEPKPCFMSVYTTCLQCIQLPVQAQLLDFYCQTFSLFFLLNLIYKILHSMNFTVQNLTLRSFLSDAMFLNYYMKYEKISKHHVLWYVDIIKWSFITSVVCFYCWWVRCNEVTIISKKVNVKQRIVKKISSEGTSKRGRYIEWMFKRGSYTEWMF